MMEQDFRSVITEQRKNKVAQKWNGTVYDYIGLVHKNPEIANFAPGRVYDMIMKHGTEDVEEQFKIAGYEDLVRYKFFDDKIYGTLEPIHDIMRFLKASARRTETGKRILIMVGPVASGKSTIASLIKRGLEMDDRPIYAITDCPLHEEPLHAIPYEQRPVWEEQLGVKIEGDLCPVCQQKLDSKEFIDEKGHVKWEELPVEKIILSEQRRTGIGTFQPSDPKSQDISELIGSINMSKLARYSEADPRAYDFQGELEVANRGIIEYIEILKADVKFHYTLLTVAQEQKIKAPKFPQIYIDEVILSHTNETEFDTFKADKKNEALHDRMYPVFVPWNLRVDDEIKIYEKMIRESDFRGVHIGPMTLKVAAQFAVLSRLIPSKRVRNLIEKMKIYNGEVTEEFKKTDIDLKVMIAEGRAQSEGRSGISPRFIINALNVALGSKEEKNCINAIDILRALKNNFSHSIGINEEEVTKYINLLMGDKDSIISEYIEIAKKEVNMAFLHAYDDQATELFNRYMMNVDAFCEKTKVLDSVTGEYSSPDEKLMRSIEELIGIPTQSKTEFRNGIYVRMAKLLKSGKPFTFKDYAPLKEAIEKKLMHDLQNVVDMSVANVTTSPKATKRREDSLKRLMENGYCEHCGNMLLKFVGEVLRKTS